MRGAARALALLVERIEASGESDMADQVGRGAVQDALRTCAARVREGPLLCRIVDGQIVLAGEAVDRSLVSHDALLAGLLSRCMTSGVGSITVRQGAAPAELFTLGTLLASLRGDGGTRSVPSITPTTLSAMDAASQSDELLRSWSVMVTRADSGSVESRATPAESIAAVSAALPEDMTTLSAAAALARLAAARSDEAARHATDQLMLVIADAESRRDSRVLEWIAIACVTQIQNVGAGGSRLTLERLLRRLQHDESLRLLGERLSYAPTRRVLLALFARAGEAAIDVLVHQLMQADDALERRVRFDCIVSLDLGAAVLFDLLRDERWFVVRNAVALLGEMGTEQADVAMLPLTRNEDERIRIAVARSLMRLGTPRALAGLHDLIEDKSVEVRRIAAASYGLASTTVGSVRPPASRLAMALESEVDEYVALEMLASLGRLGSADAIQRLLRIALPPPQQQESSERWEPKESYLRVAAIEALLQARGQAVIPALESLRNDSDRNVVLAIQRLGA